MAHDHCNTAPAHATVFMDVDHARLIASRPYRREMVNDLRAFCRQGSRDELVLLHDGIAMGGECCEIIPWPLSVQCLQGELIADGDGSLRLWCTEWAAAT